MGKRSSELLLSFSNDTIKFFSIPSHLPINKAPFAIPYYEKSSSLRKVKTEVTINYQNVLNFIKQFSPNWNKFHQRVKIKQKSGNGWYFFIQNTHKWIIFFREQIFTFKFMESLIYSKSMPKLPFYFALTSKKVLNVLKQRITAFILWKNNCSIWCTR